MNENFRYSVMSAHHKKVFIMHKLILFIAIILMAFIGIKATNPQIISSTDKVSVTIGVMVGLLVMSLAMFNRLKTLLKVKFIAFLVIWIILMSLQMIMSTLIWTIGLVMIPLMVDDLIILPYWRNVWYNIYER